MIHHKSIINYKYNFNIPFLYIIRASKLFFSLMWNMDMLSGIIIGEEDVILGLNPS